jgi:hypothetical protein
MLILIFLIASQVTISTELNAKYKNKTLTIGDPFELSVKVTYPDEITASEPFIDSLGPFMILEQTNKVVTEKGMVNNQYAIRMAVFNTGEMNLPQFKILQTQRATIDTIVSDPVTIMIQSVLPDDMTDINDIKKAVEFPNFLPLIIAGIVIACALLGYIVYRIVRHFLRKRTEEALILPPWIEALAAIDTIPVTDWLAKGWIKRYYYALSEILKHYIERRYAFNAAEQTTSEIVATMKSKKLPLQDRFHTFFLRADLVKYAKVIPPDKEIQTAVQRARDLVDQTTPHNDEDTL